ncbi:HTH-type transcriptional regulator DmlR [compost metagenome]
MLEMQHMRKDHLDGLVTFITVAEEKGFSAAAIKLGITPSAVSQSIRNLEKRLGLVLFNRTTRSVALTEIGERYLQCVHPALEQLTRASQELGREADFPSGLLRLNVSSAAYLIVLRPVLQRFFSCYPDISLELRVENQLADIVSQGFDAGIRFGSSVDKDMVALKVGPALQAQVIASPDYLVERGLPDHPRSLLEHDCINFRHATGQIERWAFAKGDEKFELQVRGRLTLNNSEVLVRSALDGLGIAYMINGYIEPFLAEGRLIRVLEDWSPSIPRFMLYYPNRRRVPAKLRALIDFLRDERSWSPPREALLA